MKKFYDSETRESQLIQRVEQKFIWQDLTPEQLTKRNNAGSSASSFVAGHSLSLRNRVTLGHKHEHVWRTRYINVLSTSGDSDTHVVCLDEDEFAAVRAEDVIVSSAEVSC